MSYTACIRKLIQKSFTTTNPKSSIETFSLAPWRAWIDRSLVPAPLGRNGAIGIGYVECFEAFAAHMLRTLP